MEQEVVRPDTRTTEYVYARVRLSPGVLKSMLDINGNPIRRNDDGSGDIVFYRYAPSREDAFELVGHVRGLSAELKYMADDIEAFIKEHESEKWLD